MKEKGRFMALPLIWLGAAAVSALAVNGLANDRKNQQKIRKQSYRPVKYSELPRHESPVAIYPTDMFTTEQRVKPEIGSVVCCGIGGLLDHTGIWVDDDTIIELDGNGLVKPISVSRFTKERSGKQMFVACDSVGRPLASSQAAERAISHMFKVYDYHLLENNCHQFVWQCFEPNDEGLTTFKTLNERIALKFDRQIFWDICDV